MSYSCKEEPEKSGMGEDPPKLKTEDHGHGFKFRYEKRVITVTCKAPITLLERLQENFYFKAMCKKNREQELVIQRSQAPRGAVSPDLPCCLINEDEVLKIFFIKSEGNRVTGQRPKLTRSLMIRQNLVTFHIRTRGDEKIRKTMRNNELKKSVDYVCVYAFKGEKVKTALKRDGRFVGLIFKNCALSEEGLENITVMSEPVDCMDGKQFQVIRSKDFQTESQESSQEYSQEYSQESETVKTKSCEDPGTSHSENTNQESTSGHEKKPQTPQKEKKSKKGPNLKEIPDTQEILKLLRDQFKGLLETLKEREKLKNTSGLQKVFREEFNNKVRLFKKVKIIKELMCLSNNVCQIRDDGGVCGTGFLLFDRFIITNAHVVQTDWKDKNMAAVFGYEDLQMGEMIGLKELVAYSKRLNEMGNYLDFALMELESPVSTEHVPELLSLCWNPPSGGSGVCIIGHPGEEVKQIDPCVVVSKEAPQNTQNDPFTDIRNLFNIMTQQGLDIGYEINDSKIPYSSCFLHGSSGSPVFDEYCKLIGVHTGGYNYQEKGLKVSVEFAMPIFNILVEIYKQCSLKNRFDVIQHFGSHQNLDLVVRRGNELLLNKS